MRIFKSCGLRIIDCNCCSNKDNKKICKISVPKEFSDVITDKDKKKLTPERLIKDFKQFMKIDILEYELRDEIWTEENYNQIFNAIRVI